MVPNTFIRCALLILAGFSTFIFITATAEPIATPGQFSGDSLIIALRQGGFTIYFRHAATDWTQVDQVESLDDIASCDPGRMRQISPAGRTVAQRIGTAIRRLKVPIGRVLSSPYCRTRETASELNLGTVQITDQIMNMRVVELMGGREAVIERARNLLATVPETGTNTILVAHGNLLLEATGAYPTEAGAAIFSPQGNKRFRLVSELKVEDWEQLASQITP